MNALVLSGGNIKGAYQAGVISALLQAGYSPGIVTGISVGALNAGYLAGLARKGGAQDWPALGRRLEQFWRDHVRSPDDFVKKRGLLDIGWNLLWKRWSGLVDTDPLHRLVTREFIQFDPRQTALQLRVGAVQLDSGDLEYKDSGEPRLIDYILASTAEPVTMPLKRIGERSFYDGGLRDIAPLKQAIDLGATRIVCAVCEPESVGPLEVGFNKGDVLHLVSRVMAIVTNEILQNDIEWFLEVNQQVRANPGQPMLVGKRYIPILVIRPSRPIRVTLEKFTPADIVWMIDQGKADTTSTVRAATADPNHAGHEIGRGLTV
jgi:NTE family protein